MLGLLLVKQARPNSVPVLLCPYGVWLFYIFPQPQTRYIACLTERMLNIMGFFNKLFGKKLDSLHAPVVGTAVPVSQVPDPTFAEELLGKGVAIEPTEGKVYAPCDATVDMMFETGHAVSLIADFGAEILIHVGLETVSLKGKHFTIHAANGDKVKKGDLLIEFDLEAIKAEGFNTITPMLVCNCAEFGTFNTYVNKPVTSADVVIELAK